MKRFFPPRGFPSRPTTDFAKEGLFNVLENEFDLSNLEVLDLFSGTGNISFEFVSRGTKMVTSVDKNYRCTRFIKETANKFNIGDNILVFNTDAFKYIEKHTKSYDLIFADPPFDSDMHNNLIDKIMSSTLLKDKEDAYLIVEHSEHINLSDRDDFYKLKKYGKVVFSFFKKKS